MEREGGRGRERGGARASRATAIGSSSSSPHGEMWYSSTAGCTLAPAFGGGEAAVASAGEGSARASGESRRCVHAHRKPAQAEARRMSRQPNKKSEADSDSPATPLPWLPSSPPSSAGVGGGGEV